eukprot:TRINITY_DN1520_c0_g1_i1.p1 TRINITY_DN1520_c0_g1~~TRINITY_DN1520_c0_g1_i1.p1  ORF type:complete len:212 (+),score=42.42 TRINITY_DN1520_c0_g1_i1:66-638(+)
METMPIADQYPSVDFNENIVLECSDSMACVLPKVLAKTCTVLNKLMSEEKGEVKVPLSEIRSDTIDKIYKYLDYHKNEWPPSLKLEQPLKEDLKETLRNEPFLLNYYENELLENGDVSKSDHIFLVLRASQYLTCEPLRDFAAAAMANLVKGVKDEQDFYDLFKVDTPFTDAEKDKLYEDYEYRNSRKGE